MDFNDSYLNFPSLTPQVNYVKTIYDILYENEKFDIEKQYLRSNFSSNKSVYCRIMSTDGMLTADNEYQALTVNRA